MSLQRSIQQQEQQRRISSRGRHNQIPKRYEFNEVNEFQKQNIPRRVSSITTKQIFDRLNTNTTTTNNNNNLLNDNNDSSLKRKNELCRVRSSNSDFRINSNPNLAQLKRHSIANIHNINMYDDNIVFETTISGRRHYGFEHQNQLTNQNHCRIKSKEFNISQQQILNNIDNNGSYVNTPRSYKNNFLEGNDRYKININNKSNEYNKEDEDSNSDESIESIEDGEDTNHTNNDIDHSEDNDNLKEFYGPEFENDSEFGFLNETHYSNNNSKIEDTTGIEFTSMRTQQRRLVIKEGIYGNVDDQDSNVASEWLNLCNYESQNIQTMKNTKKEDKFEDKFEDKLGNRLIYYDNIANKNSTATQPTIQGRNQAAHVTSELRKLALYGNKPLINSVERTKNAKNKGDYRANNIGSDNDGNVSRKISSNAADILFQIWNEARKECLV